MDFKDCLKFANDNPVSFIATMEGETLRERAFLRRYCRNICH
jgi:pyridoxamine 5'-phosphate oxidase